MKGLKLIVQDLSLFDAVCPNTVRFALGLFHKVLKFLLRRENSEVLHFCATSGNQLVFSLNETRLKETSCPLPLFSDYIFGFLDMAILFLLLC